MRPGLHARSLKAPESLHGSLDFHLNCDAKVASINRIDNYQKWTFR